MCHYNKGKDYIKTAIILSCPGSAEEKKGYPVANKTGTNLDILLSVLNEKYPNDFPSIDRYDYTITNSTDKVHSPEKDEKSEANDSEILDKKNLKRLKEEIKNCNVLLILGDKAKLAINNIEYIGKIYFWNHSSLSLLIEIKKYKSNEIDSKKRNKSRIQKVFIFSKKDESKLYNKKYIEKEKLLAEQEAEQEKANIKNNIFQAVSHTLNNIFVVENCIIEDLQDNYKKNSVVRLKLLHMLSSSLMNSIQIAFSNSEASKDKIKIFRKNQNNHISLYHLLLFCFNINLMSLMQGGGRWEDSKNVIFEINDENKKIKWSLISNYKEEFEIIELSEKEIDNFNNSFFSNEELNIKRFFKFHIKQLENLYIEKNSYTFSILFVLFTELIKNMLIHGTINDKNKIDYSINISETDDKINLQFSNLYFTLTEGSSSNTLQGVEMMKYFSSLLGGMDINKTDIGEEYYKRFMLTIIIDKEKIA